MRRLPRFGTIRSSLYSLTTPTPRCWTCFRPHRLCFCDALSTIDNQTSVLILQHRRERFHPFNTARIVHQSLTRCDLMVGHNAELAERLENVVLAPSAGLLYPSEDARLLDDLPPERRPDQLVVLDGTWHQAKTLLRDIPRLQSLPHYRLAPAAPGRYRIRREPNEHALSTLEATVAALSAIEPTTTGFERLIETFDRMVGDQIRRHGRAVPIANWRRNERRRRGSANVPHVLTGKLDGIVVAYGEREPSRPVPIFWTAVRLVSGERFECTIRSEAWSDPSLMHHLNLGEQVIRSAVGVEEFRSLWREFLRPTDRLAIQLPGTSRLLETIDAAFAPVTILKSINVQRTTVAAPEPHEASLYRDQSRAAMRLQSAVDYVYHVNSLYQSAGASD